MLRRELGLRWTDTSTLSTTCSYALQSGGKLLRPLLLLAAARTVGDDIAHVVPAAVGAECGHVASLIHDDIIDGDHTRRGQPSVHSAYGIDDAIVAGDALIFDLFSSLVECSQRGATDERVVWALDVVSRAGIDVCQGQSLESHLTRAGVFDLNAYFLVARLKTGAFFASACASGAILAYGTKAEVEALATYGTKLGIAFQVMDDVLPYTVGEESMGKPVGSDVRNARATLPVLLARRKADGDDRAAIDEALRCEREHLATDLMHAVLERTGALVEACGMAKDLVAEAKSAVGTLRESPARESLLALADVAVQRVRLPALRRRRGGVAMNVQDVLERAEKAIDLAVAHLIDRRRGDGSWVDRLSVPRARSERVRPQGADARSTPQGSGADPVQRLTGR